MNYYDGSFYSFIIMDWKGIVNYLRTDAQKCQRVEAIQGTQGDDICNERV